mmetsp:Transcript_144191/g.401763  ORF Transcript_144191/g.401763 Transcript_144191/m.401763 type:complete len:86 (-) Transcript_144191:40-297(-)
MPTRSRPFEACGSPRTVVRPAMRPCGLESRPLRAAQDRWSLLAGAARRAELHTIHGFKDNGMGLLPALRLSLCPDVSGNTVLPLL